MHVKPTDARTAELQRLGDEIAELSAHLEAATARLLELIRHSTRAQTTMPDWLGERLDVGYAIDVLHPRAIDERRRN